MIELACYAAMLTWFFLVILLTQSISAYMGMKLSGKVLATFVRGQLVYEEKHAPAACGTPILARVTD